MSKYVCNSVSCVSAQSRGTIVIQSNMVLDDSANIEEESEHTLSLSPLLPAENLVSYIARNI